MRPRTFLASLIALVVTVAGLAAPAAASPPTEGHVHGDVAPYGLTSGRVVDAHGNTVKGATIATIDRFGERQEVAKSDVWGRYSFPGALAGESYVVRATKGSYIGERTVTQKGWTDVTAPRITVKKQGRLVVRVNASSGGSSSSAEVYLMRRGEVLETRRVTVRRQTSTTVTFSKLLPGTYRVGLPGRGHSQLVKVEAGETARSKAFTAEGSGLRVLAKVKLPARWKGDDPQVTVCDKFETCTEARNGHRGEIYSYGHARGKYTLHITNPADRTPVVVTRRTVTAVKPGARQKVIKLTRARTLTVTVKNAHGHPVTNAEVLFPRGDGSGRYASTRTSTTGKAVLRGLAPYAVRVLVRDGTYGGYIATSKLVKAGTTKTTIAVTTSLTR